MADTVTPQWEHRCEDGTCTYLGPYKRADVEYDLYYHESDHGHHALYARWGNEPRDVEGMPALAPEIPQYVHGVVREALWQARRQARMRGLIP